MKKFYTLLLLAGMTRAGFSQQSAIDSLKESLSNHDGKLNALDERVLVNEADLGKLNKIKISGYVQSQWDLYGKDLVRTNEPSNTFYIRRARVKFTYEPADGIKLVLQPDFSTGNLTLKDAYAVLNIPQLNGWTIWAGQMNRPDYEVEYSSGSRETLERSRLIKAIYPGEREIGAKLEYSGTDAPVMFQLMAMNGNFTGSNARDVDSRKDLMGRFIYMIKMPSAGVGIDLGVNGYYGGNRAKTNKYVNLSDGTADSIRVGDYLKKQWVGAELRIYADILGGLSLKGEYIRGTNSTPSIIASTATMAQMKADPNKVRDFSGYYVYFIKNIGRANQFIAKYDFYDPNVRLYRDNAKSEIWYKTVTLAWQFYLNDYIRASLQYEMPRNEKNAIIKNLAGEANAQLKDNVLGIRIQSKF